MLSYPCGIVSHKYVRDLVVKKEVCMSIIKSLTTAQLYAVLLAIEQVVRAENPYRECAIIVTEACKEIDARLKDMEVFERG